MSVPDYVRSLPLVALYTAGIYLFLIAGFRIVGRRQLGQFNIVDLVIILIMGSAVETAMVDGNLSLPAGFVSAATLLAMNRLLAVAATRSRRIHRMLAPSPVLVVANGRLIDEHIRRAGLTEADVMEALRERGFCDIADVRFAVIEEDGEIDAIECSEPVLTAPAVKPQPSPSGSA